MDGSTSSKVEAAKNEHPAICVPCPAGNGIIDDCGPDEDEDAAGEHAATFGSCTNCESGSDGCEHTLEDSEEEIGDFAALLCQNTLHTEVVQVANESACSLGECQGITPEKPLRGQRPMHWYEIPEMILLLLTLKRAR